MDQETLRGQTSQYRIYESIASGGFASVFYGRDTASNVPAAVKRLHPHLTAEPGVVERFEQEAETVRGLIHPNIVRLLDRGRDAQDVPFIVMEWVEGLTIGDWLKRNGRYASQQAADLGCQALEGLNAAWAQRIVHRDIKPANLMVTPSGRLKIMDFGVAKDVDLATAMGSSGLIGTPAYMAPEQLRGQPLDCRVDLYSLGVTLFVMLTGRAPFEGPSFADYFRQHLEQEPPRIEDLSPDVDAGLATVLRKALAKDPAERFGTPAEMLTALRPHASLPVADEPTIVTRTPIPPIPASAATGPVAPETPSPQPPSSQTPPPEATEYVSAVEAQAPVAKPVIGTEHVVPAAPVAIPARRPRLPVALIAAAAVVAALVAGGVLFASRQLTLLQTATTPAEFTPGPSPLALASAIASPSVVGRTWRMLGGTDSALFNEPVGVAFDAQGTAYVSNNGTHTITKVDASGNVVARWGGENGAPQLRNPGGLAADDNGAIYVADTTNDRIVHLSSVGAVIGQVGGHGQDPGHFDGPRAVAVDGADNLYVADTGNHRIQKLGPNNKVLAVWGSFGNGAAQFNSPYGVALDKQGNIYVADRNNNRVVKLSPDGKQLAAWPTNSNADTALMNPSSVAVDSSGQIYVAGWASERVERIQKLSPSGELIGNRTIDGKNPAQVSLPIQLAFDPRGNVSVAEPGADQLDSFAQDGTPIGALGAPRDAVGQFRRPNNVAIDSRDRLYVADWGNERIQSSAIADAAIPSPAPIQPPNQWGRFTDVQGVAVDRTGNIYMTEHTDCRVRKISAAGDTVGLWGSCGNSQQQFQSPEAIAVDRGGNAYVADRGNDRIVKLTPSGQVATMFGSHGSGDGQFDQPTGVTVDAQGNIYVADRNNQRVVKLSSSGQLEAIWGNQNNPALRLSAPEGVAVGSRGNVYIADWGSSRIIELSPTGDLVAAFGGPGTKLGQFESPEGLAVDSQGRLFVADTGNNRVQELAP